MPTDSVTVPVKADAIAVGVDRGDLEAHRVGAERIRQIDPHLRWRGVRGRCGDGTGGEHDHHERDHRADRPTNPTPPASPDLIPRTRIPHSRIVPTGRGVHGRTGRDRTTR